MKDTFVRRLGRACERFGLGRLLGAGRRVPGAGYAFAATALLVGVLLFVTEVLLGVVGVLGRVSLSELLFVVGVLPFVTVSAFCSAVAVWRVLPDDSPRYGAVGGFVATCLAYLLSTVFLFPVVLLLGGDGPFLYVSGPVALTLLLAVFGTLSSAWLTLPAGAAVGYVYESVRVHHQKT